MYRCLERPVQVRGSLVGSCPGHRVYTSYALWCAQPALSSPSLSSPCPFHDCQASLHPIVCLSEDLAQQSVARSPVAKEFYFRVAYMWLEHFSNVLVDVVHGVGRDQSVIAHVWAKEQPDTLSTTLLASGSDTSSFAILSRSHCCNLAWN